MTHDLKTWPVFFRETIAGRKTFELRRHDRNYALGDLLTMREYEPHRNTYTGRTWTGRITTILTADQAPAGLQPGYSILGLEHIPDGAVEPVRPPEPSPQPTGIPLRARILDLTPASIVVEDEHGERHAIPVARNPISPTRPIEKGEPCTITMTSEGWQLARGPHQPMDE